MVLRIFYLTFFLCWLYMFIVVFYICERDQSWKSNPFPICPLGKAFAIAILFTEIIGDVLLCCPPVWLIWKVISPRRYKLRIISVFFASLISTGAGMYRAYGTWDPDPSSQSAAVIINFSVCLLVANIYFLAGVLFGTNQEDGETSGTQRTSLQLTTVMRWSQAGTQGKVTSIIAEGDSASPPFGKDGDRLDDITGIRSQDGV